MNLELYKKMLRGECSPEETRQVLQWLETHAEQLDSHMLQDINNLEEERQMPSHTRQQILSFFESKGIAPKTEPAIMAALPVASHRHKWYAGAAAAAIVFAVAIGCLLYTSSLRKTPSLAWKQIHNTGTTLQQVTLPDSSTVWLHSKAMLRYREDFNLHAERQVQLTGEGYFKVAQQASHPFVVQTGALTTQVLGTAFNVEAYDNEQFIKVTLQEGKVQVTDLPHSNKIQSRAILQPGQMALYTKSDAKLAVARSPIKDAAAWTSEGLVLSDVPLPDALRRIAHKYNQEIQFNSVQAMRHQHITAQYQQMDIEQVLTQLGFTCGFRTVKTAKDHYRIIWD